MDKILNESLRLVKKLTSKGKKSMITKELIVQVALRQMLYDLEAKKETSVLLTEISKILDK